MGETRYRAGSKTQELWEAYSTKGKEVAAKIGKKVGLKESSIEEYFRRWGTESDKLPTERSSPKIKYFDIGNPKVELTITKQGPEVSEVRFPDGKTQFIPNNKLIPVGFFNEDCQTVYQNAKKFAVMDGNRRVAVEEKFSSAKRRCSGNKMFHIYALTSSNRVRIIPRVVWDKYPNVKSQ